MKVYAIRNAVIALFLNGIILLAVWLIWIFVDFRVVIELETLTDVALRQSSAVKQQVIEDVSFAIALAILAAISIGTCVACLWHGLTAFLPVIGPGRAGKYRVVWFGLFIIAVVAADSLTYWHLAIETDLIKREAVVAMLAANSAVVWICFHVIGTLFTTTAVLRPAVPFSSIFARN